MPHWNMEIDLAGVFHNDDLSFEEKRDKIVEKIQDSDWLHFSDWSRDVRRILKNLQSTQTIEEFDVQWNALYDYADVDRIWINTF